MHEQLECIDLQPKPILFSIQLSVVYCSKLTKSMTEITKISIHKKINKNQNQFVNYK